MQELADQVAVVTGGARGIGRRIAERFLQEGATVVIGDRNVEGAEQVVSELRAIGNIHARPLEVTDWASVARFFEEVERDFGGCHISVNNAGVQAIAPSLEMTQAQWDSVIAVNLSGVFACSQAAGRIMARRGGGSIVNLASAAGVMALPGRAPYCSSKAAVIGLTKVLAVEWADIGIRVNAIGPGWVLTDLVREAIAAGHLSEEKIKGRTPLNRLGEMDEIAEVALFLASRRSSYVTGHTLLADGGFSAFGGWK